MSQCGSCGSCANSGCGGHGRELVLTGQEIALLERLGEVAFLPVARRWDSEDPVYLEDHNCTQEEYSRVLRLLELKGLISLDYHLPLQNFDYSAYAGYGAQGSMALTAEGQQALELLAVQGFRE